MKALSIMQPWAWLILSETPDREGWTKDVENRKWNSNYKGPLLIHAPRSYDWPGHHWITRRGITIPKNLSRGGLVGVVTMAGVVTAVTASKNPFFRGPYGFKFINPIPFQSMVPFPGRQRFFSVEIDFEARLGPGVSLRFGYKKGEA